MPRHDRLKPRMSRSAIASVFLRFATLLSLIGALLSEDPDADAADAALVALCARLCEVLQLFARRLLDAVPAPFP